MHLRCLRRYPFSERHSLFDNNQLLASMDGDDKKQLKVKLQKEWSSWMADEYKKAISGLKGTLIAGDYRNINSIPADANGKPFTYTLLVSHNNEFALEIEQYGDGKMEVYATVYRRLSDIGEITPPKADKVIESTPQPASPAPKKKANTASDLAALKPANDSVAKETPTSFIAEKQPDQEIKTRPFPLAEFPAFTQEKTPAATPETAQAEPLARQDKASHDEVPAFEEDSKDIASLSNLPESIEPVRQEVPGITAQDMNADEAPSEKAAPDLSPLVEEKPLQTAPAQPQELENIKPEEPAQQEQQAQQTSSAAQEPVESQVETTDETPKASQLEVQQPQTLPHTENNQTKEQDMATFNANINGGTDTQSAAFQARAIKPQPQEVENDSVECELPAANRVIEEAIRNEMSMSDVIRRVVALPVARQETVSIPVMLTDSDYSLLAVRYGIPAADRAAIKAKIIEELGEFTGK